MEGAWRGGGVLLLLSVGLCLLAVGGCGGEDEPKAKPLVGATVTDSPAHTFAPVVYMHRDERYLPMSGKDFVSKSILYFGDGDGCRNHKVAVGRRELTRLTEQPTYRARPYVDLECRRRSARAYGAEEVTRPHENTSARVRGLRPDEGFYLDLRNSERGGAAATTDGGRANLYGAAAWYEQYPQQVRGEPGRRITWWLLHGMHAPRQAHGGPLPDLTHEGDWERVDLLLRGSGRRWKPEAVRLHDPDDGTGAGKGGAREIPWDELVREAALTPAPGQGGRTHPALFAALGTHTLYARPGNRVLREVDMMGNPSRTRDVALGRCPRCPRIEMERPGFSLDSQYWYGFGGGWGERGRTTLMTGPLGPRPPGS